MNNLSKYYCCCTVALLLIFSSFGRAQTLNKQDKEVLQGLWISYAKNSASEQNFISLLNRGVDINTRDENGATALMWAAYRRNWPLIEFLLEKGANPKIKGIIYFDSQKSDGYVGSLLSAAIVGGEYSAVRIIYEKTKVSPFEYDVAPLNNTTKIAPIHRACQARANAIEFINLLIRTTDQLEPEINLMAKMSEGTFSTLMLAVMSNDDYLCKVLLVEGANPALLNDKGETALQMAERLELIDVIQVLKLKTSSDDSNDRLNSKIFTDEQKNSIQQKLDDFTVLQKIYATKGDTISAGRTATEIIAVKTQIYKNKKMAEVGRFNNQTMRMIPDEYASKVDIALRFIKGMLKLIRKKNRIQYEKELVPLGSMLLSMGMNEELENFSDGFQTKSMKYQRIIAQKRQGRFKEAIENIQGLQVELSFEEDSLKAKLDIELGSIYEEMGNLEKAEQQWNDVLNTPRLANTNSYLYRDAYNRLGMLYQNIGQNTKAKLFLEESILFSSMPNDNFDFIDNDLSLLDTSKEPVTPQKISAAMVGASFGIINQDLKPFIEDSLSKMREIFEKLAERGERPSTFYDSLEKREKRFISLHNSFTNSAFAIFALGNIAFEEKKYAQALHNFHRAAIMFERIWGRFNIYYWYCLVNISQIYFKTGDFQQSEYYTNVVFKNLKLFSSEFYNFTVDEVPNMLLTMKAFSDYQRLIATDINVFYDYATFGKTQHLKENQKATFSVEQAYNSVTLASLYLQLGDLIHAEQLYKKALTENGIDEENYRIAYLGLGQISQARNQLNNARQYFVQALTPAANAKQHQYMVDIKLRIAQLEIKQKNISNAIKLLKEATTELRNWANLFKDKARKEEKFYAARSIEKQILILNGTYMLILKHQPDIAAKFWEHINWQKNNQLISGYVKRDSITLSKIQSRLPVNSVLAEYFQFSSLISEEDIHYGIILIAKDRMRVFNIASHNEIINILKSDSIYQEVDFFNRLIPVKNLGLIGIKKIFISPNGLLHQIAFGALKENQNHAIEKYNIVYLLNVAELLRQEIKIDFSNAKIDLWGGIEFGKVELDSTGNLPNPWQYLQGSRKEVKELSNILSKKAKNVQVIEGEKASESLFHYYDLKSPHILHLATHGFFFKETSRKDSYIKSIFEVSEDPLDRSGLILKGANTKWYKKGSLLEPLDGVLTAKEISKLNLFKTNLVVLSACQTGLGETQGNFGIFGLQKAFKQAGVDYLVVSLWPVPDKESYEMMQLFYTNLTNNLSIEASFNNAQREMMKKYSPFYWAGFVLIR